MHRAWALISLGALSRNVVALQSRTSKNNTKMKYLAVLKADAYGHGLQEIALHLQKCNVDYMATALLTEALQLRNWGIQTPLIAWLVPPGSDFKTAIDRNIELAIPSVEILQEVAAAARTVGKRARVHLELDTGMIRGGYGAWGDCDISPMLRDLYLEEKFIKLVGTWSHFARADEPDELFNTQQLDSFETAIRKMHTAEINPGLLHISNSAAIITNQRATFDMLRMGIAMYGLSPNATNICLSSNLVLEPVMELRARVHLVKNVDAGRPVGYGGTVVTNKSTQVAVIPLGYADGISRLTDNSAYIFTPEGKRAYLLGRVSMDQFVVDLGQNSTTRAGDEVILFGTGKSGEATADVWARAAGTINYEVVTRLGNRVPRIIIN